MTRNVRLDKSLITALQDIKIEMLTKVGVEITTSQASKLLAYRLKGTNNMVIKKKKRGADIKII